MDAAGPACCVFGHVDVESIAQSWHEFLGKEVADVDVPRRKKVTALHTG